MRANTTAEVHCVFPYAFQPTYISTSQETRRSENKTTSVAGVRENNLNNLHRVLVECPLHARLSFGQLFNCCCRLWKIRVDVLLLGGYFFVLSQLSKLRVMALIKCTILPRHFLLQFFSQKRQKKNELGLATLLVGLLRANLKIYRPQS